ncbi:MAG: ribonuclease HI [Thiotrichales bacterium]|nr:ribonuclease HI [Thiotrichales bacterium]|tara:strand:- start:184 stop:636 length:453 start_codon:yes stop_codon:yes gene_type:complete
MAATVEIYTDGACSGNPGPGGWGVLLRCGGHERTLSGAHPYTTNNRMELTAVIEALQALTRSSRVLLTTDSRYVMDGITEWLPGWKRRGWLTAARKPVKNVDLWKQLDGVVGQHDIEWRWVKGHSGHVDNERVDRLAREALEGLDASDSG